MMFVTERYFALSRMTLQRKSICVERGYVPTPMKFVTERLNTVKNNLENRVRRNKVEHKKAMIIEMRTCPQQ